MLSVDTFMRTIPLTKHLDRLLEIEARDWITSNEVEVDEIDDRIKEGMLTAKKKACRKRRLP